MKMTLAQAQARQYNRATVYTVWLVGPAGEREQVGTTQRKSGMGLLKVLQRESVQARLAALPGAATGTFTKRADRLEFSSGWRLEFGGTITQEAAQ